MKKLHKNIYVSGQISPHDFNFLKSSGIKTIINNRPDNEESGQLESSEAAKLAQEHHIDYHYLPMVNGQPVENSLVESFKNIIDNTDDAVLIHCRSGMRSSFLWALGQIPDGKISVEEAISKAKAAGIPLDTARAVLEGLNT